MKKNKLLIGQLLKIAAIFVLIIGLFTGCATTPSAKPESLEASIIDDPDINLVRVYAYGLGLSVDEAELDAKKAAVDKVIKDRIQLKPDEKLKFKIKEERFYQDIREYIEEGSMVKEALRRDGDYFKLPVYVVVRTDRVRQELVNLEIIADVKDLMGNAAFMVLPHTGGKQDLAFAEETLNNDNNLLTAQNRLQTYLTQQGYDVRRVSTNKLKFDEATQSGEVDLSYRRAIRFASADFYIVFRLEIAERNERGATGKKAIVFVDAWNPTTDQVFSSQSGHSETSLYGSITETSLIEQAVTNLVDQAMMTVISNWKDQLKKGIEYDLTIHTKPGQANAIWENTLIQALDNLERDGIVKESKMGNVADKIIKYRLLIASEQQIEKIILAFKREFQSISNLNLTRDPSSMGNYLIFRLD